MSDREQWRFQWPDGTWIRWNPQTQSWEKEDQASAGTSSAGSASEVQRPTRGPQPSTSPPSRPVSEGAGWQPIASHPATASPRAEPPVTPEPVRAPEPVGIAELEPDPAPEREPAHATTETQVTEQRAAATASTRGHRSSAPDVLPPRQEPERPGGSLWPTVIAGAVVGLAVGLLLSAVIR